MGELQNMLNAQLEFQKFLAERGRATDPTIPPDPDYLRLMKDALESELDELQNETGWKPWATSRHVNLEAAQSEVVDAWHFMMNIMVHLKLDEHKLAALYYKKLEKNKQRQMDGYDGVSTKCPGCRRALDDDGVLCYRVPSTETGPATYWCVQGRATVRDMGDIIHMPARKPE